MRKIAVVGLGRFGMVVARQLAAMGAQVIAIDSDAALIEEIKDEVDLAVRLDATDQAALAAQEIDRVEICVIAIGENFEASLLATVIVKKLGVPRIICRAQTAFHAEIFRQIGVDEVIQPEAQAGENLARKLAHPHLDDFIHLAEGFTLIELRAPEAFLGKTVQEISLRPKYGVNLVAIKRMPPEEHAAQASERIISVPRAGDVIEAGDVLVLIGSNEALGRLPQE